MADILTVKRLTKVYGQREPKVHALRGVSFSVPEQSFTALVGRSGSGKTTLLNCVGGLERPTAGDVIVSGEHIYAMKDDERTVFRRRHIGYVFQFFNLLSELTVWKNVCLPAYLDKQQPDEGYAHKILRQLGLEEKLDKYPMELSGGEQQRTAVARALASKPDILLADEPTGNLDKRNGDDLIELLLFSHRYFEQTVLLVTHDLAIARRAQRIITLEDGRVLSDTADGGL